MFNNGNCNDGFSDVIALAIIAMIFGWGGYGNGGLFGGGTSGAATNYVLSSDFATIQRQLSDGFGSTESKLDSVNNGICSLGYDQLGQMNALGINVMQTGNAIQTQLADCCCKTQSGIERINTGAAMNTAAIQAAIKDCCCDSQMQTMQTRYDMANQNCATLQAIDKLGDRIIGYMADSERQNMRDENFALKLAASQANQNTYLINQLRPAPIPAFTVPAPFGFGYGYGTTIA